MTNSLLQKFLDNAFEASVDPGRSKLRLTSLPRDLERVGLSHLHKKETEHIKAIISEDKGGQAFLTYDDLVKNLLEKDFVFDDKRALEEKLEMRRKRKEQEAKERRKELDPNFLQMKDLEDRVAQEARRRLGSPEAVIAPQEDLGVVFEIAERLQKVLDKRRARLLDAYKEMDLEGKGHISKVDLGKGLRRLGVLLSRSQLDQFFNVMDFDKSGSLEFREFSKVMQSANTKRQEDMLRREHEITSGRGRSHSPPPNNAVPVLVDENQSPKAFLTAEESDEDTKQGGEDNNDDEDEDEKPCSPYVTLKVSDREFCLRKENISRYPDSLLGQVVSSYSNYEIFLDLNPDVFEYVVSKFFVSKRSKEAISFDDAAPPVNIHTVLQMCSTLGLPNPAPLILSDSKEVTSSHSHQESETELASRHGTCGRHSRDSEFKLQVTRVVSSNTEGIELHVREGEVLILDLVAGAGQLLMDVFSGNQDVRPQCRARDIIVYDSRAFFHIAEMESIKLGTRFPGNAHYRFHSNTCDRSKNNLQPATISASFLIETGFKCSSCTQNSVKKLN